MVTLDPCSQVSGIITITDSQNPNRYVKTGETLVMVGEKREAKINLSYNSSYSGDLDFAWNGNGVTGNGSSGAIYSGSSDSKVSVNLLNNCEPIVGYIDIVPENNQDISTEVELINKNLKTISNKTKELLSSMSNDIDINISVTGEGEYKRVDKYNDGENYGKYYNISLGVQGDFSLPEIKTPAIPVYGLLKVQASLTPGIFTVKGNVSGIYDESKSSKGSIAGSFYIGLTNLSANGYVFTGDPNVICLYAKASLALKSLILNGVIHNTNNSLVVTPIYNLNKITAIISVGFKVNIMDTEYTPWSYPHVFYEGYNKTGTDIKLLTY